MNVTTSPKGVLVSFLWFSEKCPPSPLLDTLSINCLSMSCDTPHLVQSYHHFEVSHANKYLLTSLYIFVSSNQVWKNVPDVTDLSQ